VFPRVRWFLHIECVRKMATVPNDRQHQPEEHGAGEPALSSHHRLQRQPSQEVRGGAVPSVRVRL
jgi:hypothetical protein